MARRMSESTEALLAALEADLRQQLGRRAVLERLVMREKPDGTVTLVAALRASSQHELSASGENVIAAYAGLTQALPELVLAATYRQVLEHGLDA